MITFAIHAISSKTWIACTLMSKTLIGNNHILDNIEKDGSMYILPECFVGIIKND